jgi:hypothetical protein
MVHGARGAVHNHIPYLTLQVRGRLTRPDRAIKQPTSSWAVCFTWESILYNERAFCETHLYTLVLLCLPPGPIRYTRGRTSSSVADGRRLSEGGRGRWRYAACCKQHHSSHVPVRYANTLFEYSCRCSVRYEGERRETWAKAMGCHAVSSV